MKKPYYIDRTSVFIHIPVIVLMLLLAVTAAYFGMTDIAAVLLFLTFVSLTAYLWGRLSLHKTKVSLKINRHVLTPGEEAVFRVTVENEKWLPLISILLRLPVPAGKCVAPVDEEDCRLLDDIEISKARLYHAEIRYVAERKFAFLKGHSLLVWESRWKARSRGLYKADGLELYGGDGFGLMQRGMEITPDPANFIAVCPPRVSINRRALMRNASISNQGTHGIYDDVTLIRTTRDYQECDAIKHINWRLLATQQRAVVNVYERFKAKGIHLILDGESYNGEKPDLKALEKTIQLIYSILVEMETAGMGCGLSLPKSKAFAPVSLPCGDGYSLEQAACYLAGYALLSLEEEEKEARVPILMEKSSLSMAITAAREMKQKQEGTYMLSVSAFSAADTAPERDDIEEFFYFTYDAGRLALQETGLLKALHGKNVTIVSYKDAENNVSEHSYRTINLSALGGEPDETAK